MRTILGIALVLLVVTFATQAPAGPPEHFWSQRFGSTGNDQAWAVVVDAVGNVVVLGWFEGTVNFGGGNLVSAGGDDIFMAKYNANGVHQWSQRFGSTGDDLPLAVASDGANIFVTGYFNGTVNFGGTNLVSAGNWDIFLAKYDANGGHQWSQRFGSTDLDFGSGIAVDGSGNLVLTGSLRGTVDLGGGNLVSAGGFDIFVAKYNSSGVHQWSQRFGSTSDDNGKSIAVDVSGNLIVTGAFQGTVDFGGGNLVSAGAADIFLAKYNTSGVHQWSQRFGGTGNDGGAGIAVDVSGNLIVTGSFQGTMDLGGGNLVSAGAHDIFLAKYDASGVHQWSERFGSTGNDIADAPALDGAGNVFVTGYFDGTVNFGGGNLVSAGSSDIFLAKYNVSGAHQWSQRFGDSIQDFGNGVAVDGLGRAIAVGGFDGTVNFGGGNLVSAGSNEDGYIAQYGNPPVIIKIVDGPFDNGSHVEINFKGSHHDAPGIHPRVLQYQAFRRSISPAGPPFVLAGEIPATSAESYVMDATTDGDSTCASGHHYSFFYIRGMTETPGVFFDSPIDSGYSVDNLPPGVPTNFTYAAGHLSWDSSTAADFDHFSAYGSNTNSFGSATFVNNTVTPGMNVPPPLYAYYFVTATDHACNESGAASTGTLTGVGGTPPTYALSISAYPNPFNPETTIRYTLPAKGRVTINVFDARGAHVATLVDAVTPAGAYTIKWNGHDDRGNAVGSGVFFARLTSLAGVRSYYKMTLLK